MKRFAIALALLICASSPAKAQHQDLAWAGKGYEQFGMQAEMHMRAYIDGFRSLYLSMYVTQSQIDGGNPPEGNAAIETFIDCIFLNDESEATYDRLIAAVEESPKMLVMTWLRKDFEKQCGDELTAALSVLAEEVEWLRRGSFDSSVGVSFFVRASG